MYEKYIYYWKRIYFFRYDYFLLTINLHKKDETYIFLKV